MKAKAITFDDKTVEVDVCFIVLCLEHGAAFGPYPDTRTAQDIVEVMTREECKLEVMAVMSTDNAVPAKSAWPAPGAYL